MGYALRRLGYVVPVMFVVSLATFGLLNLVPGDPAMVIAGEFADDDEVAAVREELGLNAPFVERYLAWLTDALLGDLGRSYISQVRVSELIAERLAVTIELAILSELIGLALAIPTGIYCAYRAGSRVDRFIMASSFVVLAAPVYVLALLLLLFVAEPVSWIPSIGYTPMDESLSANLRGMLLPALTVGLASWPFLTRLIRSDVINTLQQDYIALARAKGLTTSQILLRHALRPSSITLLAALGVSFAARIDGLLIVEIIFAIPGIGRLLFDAIQVQDYVLVQGLVLFIAATYVVMNLLADLMLAVADPRIRQR